ncbi:hypothetical protein BKI52_12800 [marine bacterium AO1-C]|nr:hypothetical protein BKI52_12800 [marine bacterium AO1-C]
MIKNYLKIALRNLLRNKLFSGLNILGLIIGMVSCLLILQYVQFEMSYDSFHKNADNIYRLRSQEYQNKQLVADGVFSFLRTGEMMLKEFPEVTTFTSIYHKEVSTLAHQERHFKETNLYIVDPSFLEVFSFKLFKGQVNTVLQKPASIVLTRAMANKYFPGENPIGKILELDGQQKLTVTGVIENPPANSHLKFNGLISNHALRKEYIAKRRTWAWGDFFTYVVLQPKTKTSQIEAKFPAFIKKYLQPQDAAVTRYLLQPLSDIHLQAGLGGDLTPAGDARAMYLLLIIALFILIIAWVNYINLATARATDRAKEVGIRKVVGAYRKQLVLQFLGEAFLMNLIACLLTILLVDLITPLFDRFVGKALVFDIWQNQQFWFIFGGMFLLGVVFSGLYPAFVLSSFKPVTVLKGKIIRSHQGIALRKGLSLFQFAASILLIGGTIVVFQQLNFMRSQDLGMNITQTLAVEGPRITGEEFASRNKVFTQKIIQLAQVKSISASSCIPGKEFYGSSSGIKLKGQSGGGVILYQAWISENYIPAYEFKLQAGRNFSKNKQHYDQRNSVIINEASAKSLGYTPSQILHKKLMYDKKEWKIIGVLKDFHQTSLKEKAAPVMLFYDPQVHDYYSIKIRATDMQKNIASIKSAYLQMFPKNTFDYFFLDVAYDAQYKADQRFGEMFTLFSGLAIFVACMGLFGLTTFTLVQRTKELGIRKVLGASGKSLMQLLLIDFLKPIALAGVLALPILYWGVQEWLQNFAYRMNLNIWLFLLPLLLMAIIAFLTVSVQTFKATRHNPVDSLRYE